MPEIVWDQSMCVGVEEIDRQHAHLTRIINTLYHAYMEGKDKDILQAIITEVNDYARCHFATEEKFMRRFEGEYPDMAAHLAAHTDFFSTLIDFLLQCANDEERDITPDLLDYLMDWWFEHENVMDRELGSFLVSRNVR